jgi:hypothetical protein
MELLTGARVEARRELNDPRRGFIRKGQTGQVVDRKVVYTVRFEGGVTLHHLSETDLDGDPWPPLRPVSHSRPAASPPPGAP